MTLAICPFEIDDFSGQHLDSRVELDNKFENVIDAHAPGFDYGGERYDGPFAFLLGEELVVDADGNYIRRTDMRGREVPAWEMDALGDFWAGDLVERIRDVVRASRSTGAIYQVYV